MVPRPRNKANKSLPQNLYFDSRRSTYRYRRPDRKKLKQAQTKDHWTQVEERYLTRAFKEAREAAGCYKGWKEEEMPGFHEVRALSLHLYQKAGKDGQKIAGHASETMTKNYQKDHAEIVWSEAIPDLNIREITG